MHSGKLVCWVGDEQLQVGRMISCDDYYGDYSIRGGGVDVHNDKQQSLIL